MQNANRMMIVAGRPQFVLNTVVLVAIRQGIAAIKLQIVASVPSVNQANAHKMASNKLIGGTKRLSNYVVTLNFNKIWNKFYIN
jgi:hypothetical protein